MPYLPDSSYEVHRQCRPAQKEMDVLAEAVVLLCNAKGSLFRTRICYCKTPRGAQCLFFKHTLAVLSDSQLYRAGRQCATHRKRQTSPVKRRALGPKQDLSRETTVFFALPDALPTGGAGRPQITRPHLEVTLCCLLSRGATSFCR